jgi:hypothetical protein
MPESKKYFGWAKRKAGAKYAGIGERTFNKWFKAGLRFVRLPSGTILTKYQWIDEFLESFEVYQDKVKDEIDETVDEILKGFA